MITDSEYSFPSPEGILVARKECVDACVWWLLKEIRRLTTLVVRAGRHALLEEGLDFDLNEQRLNVPAGKPWPEKWTLDLALPIASQIMERAGWRLTSVNDDDTPASFVWRQPTASECGWYIVGRMRPWKSLNVKQGPYR